MSVTLRVHRRDPPSRGLTLIECCAVLVILGIVAGSAVPGFRALMERRALEGRANELATDLQWLRSEAVARNRTLRISFRSGAEGSCYVIYGGASDTCACMAEGPAQCIAGSEAMKSVFLPVSGAVRLESNVGSMIYDPLHGTTTVGATLRLVGAGGQSIRHIVNIMGRVRSCSPRGEVAGYRPC
jgi:type IV fimbrial biogenesis protein FimT